MLVTFLQQLGTDDANFCKKKFAEDIDVKKCSIGATVELPDKSAEFLAKKYPALFKPAARVRGEAKQSEITAPAK